MRAASSRIWSTMTNSKQTNKPNLIRSDNPKADTAQLIMDPPVGLSNERSHGYSGQRFPTGSESKRVLVDGYTQLVTDRVQAGWTCDLVTILFSPLTGARSSVISKMMDEVQRIYSTLVTRVHRKPRTAPNDELPVLVGAADLPVYKRDKVSYPSRVLQRRAPFSFSGPDTIRIAPQGAACRTPGKQPRPLCWYRDVDPTHPCRSSNEGRVASGRLRAEDDPERSPIVR
jgi:hypothetical protein